MIELELMFRGMLAGLAISASVGPVNLFVVSRALTKNCRMGLVAGLGAATADTIYGAIAGFSISFVIQFLIREIFWIRLFGGVLLIGIGIVYYLKKPRPLKDFEGDTSPHSDFVSAFLLNLTNPTTVLSFLAVLAALHMSQHRAGWQTLILVAGIWSGAMLWWLVLSQVASHFHSRVNDGTMLWMNRIAGLAIGAFGVITLILSRKR